MLVIGVAGVLGIGEPPDPIRCSIPGHRRSLSFVALAVWLLIGAEFVCLLVEEAEKPSRNIPLAMITGLIIIFLLNLLFGVAGAPLCSMDKLSTSPTLRSRRLRGAILGKVGLYWIGIASFFATAGVMNTLLAAVPRMLYGMAHAGQVPSIFKWLHPRFRTPWIGIIYARHRHVRSSGHRHLGD